MDNPFYCITTIAICTLRDASVKILTDGPDKKKCIIFLYEKEKETKIKKETRIKKRSHTGTIDKSFYILVCKQQIGLKAT